MKIGILFAGQGSQHSGMGKDFYDRFPAARAVYDRVHIDIDVKKLCFEGTQEELNDTAVAQPCILTTSSAIAARIERKRHSRRCGCRTEPWRIFRSWLMPVYLRRNQGAALVRERGKIMGSGFAGRDKRHGSCFEYR